jgi:hypothetical protein
MSFCDGGHSKKRESKTSTKSDHAHNESNGIFREFDDEDVLPLLSLVYRRVVGRR